MKLDKIREILESSHIIQNEEIYYQFAGLKYNPKIIEGMSKIKIQSCKLFIESFTEPRELFLSSIETLAEDKTKNLETLLHKTRNREIIDKNYKIQNNYINWSNWRQFNGLEKESENRKKVFDNFIQKTNSIRPLIEKRFTKIMEIYEKDGHMNPLEGYLEIEHISHQELKNFILEISERSKKSFQEKFIEISKEILRRNPEYFDDFYYFRNIIFKDISNEFIEINPVQSVLRTLKDLKINTKNISFDTEDRMNKYPSPICFFIDIPKDIRILYKKESPYFDFQGCYHETGHAMHAVTINKGLEYENKYHIPMGVTEIFSIFLERLTKNKTYLQKHLGITNKKTLDKIVELNNFMELFFIIFYSVNSLTKMEFWDKKLSIDKTNESYSKNMKKYLGIDMPGEYWMLHHIMPESIMYVPSYLLAAVRAAELESKIKEKFGIDWWKKEEAGEFLKIIMKYGAKIKLEEFSKLDSSVFLKEIII